MGRRIKLTNEQLYMLKENDHLTVLADTEDGTKSPADAVADTQRNLIDRGINPKDVAIQTTAESKVITKKSIYENRLNALKKNSTVYSLRDFLKK